MSFGGDSSMSTMMQGATKSGGFGTLLGSSDDSGAGSLRTANPIQGKKPKGRSPSSSFLGQEATPMAGAGRTTLLGSAA